MLLKKKPQNFSNTQTSSIVIYCHYLISKYLVLWVRFSAIVPWWRGGFKMIERTMQPRSYTCAVYSKAHLPTEL